MSCLIYFLAFKYMAALDYKKGNNGFCPSCSVGICLQCMQRKLLSILLINPIVIIFLNLYPDSIIE